MYNRAVAIGIVGCGVMGRVYAKAMQGESAVRLVAVADRDREAAAAVASEFAVPHHFDSAEQLIEHAEVEAVIFAVPPAGFKTKLALYAFSLGKHALLEKPIALTLEEAERLVLASEGLVAASCSARLRFSDSAEAVRRVLEEGRLGALRTLSSRWMIPAKGRPETPPPAWRLNPALNGGGNLTNLGTYILDYMFGVTGWQLVPQTVTGRVWRMPDSFADYVPEGSAGETHSAALVLCAGPDGASNGPVLTIEQGEYLTGPEEAAWQINGDRGALRFRTVPGASNEVDLYQYEDNQVKATTVWSGPETFAELHRRTVLDFAGAIAEGRAPRTTLRQGYEIQRLIDAVYRSSTSGQPVHLS